MGVFLAQKLIKNSIGEFVAYDAHAVDLGIGVLACRGAKGFPELRER
jgi:hypothetical protein